MLKIPEPIKLSESEFEAWDGFIAAAMSANAVAPHPHEAQEYAAYAANMADAMVVERRKRLKAVRS